MILWGKPGEYFGANLGYHEGIRGRGRGEGLVDTLGQTWGIMKVLGGGGGLVNTLGQTWGIIKVSKGGGLVNTGGIMKVLLVISRRIGESFSKLKCKNPTQLGLKKFL